MIVCKHFLLLFVVLCSGSAQWDNGFQQIGDIGSVLSGQNCTAPEVKVHGFCASPPGGYCKIGVKGCVPNAKCAGNVCTCHPNAPQQNYPPYSFCVATGENDYQKSCSFNNHCDIGVCDNSGHCTCPVDIGPVVYDPVALGIDVGRFGVVSTTLGACTCASNATYDTNQTKCICLDQTVASSNSCIPFQNAILDPYNYTYGCAEGAQINLTTSSCDCIMTHAKFDIDKQICFCPGDSAPNSDGSACIGFYGASLNSSDIFGCPPNTTGNTNTSICDCLMPYSTYSVEHNRCKCQGKTKFNGTACNPYEYSTFNGTTYECPEKTQSNYTAGSCDCIPNSSREQNSSDCECVGKTRPDTCEPFTNAVQNDDGIFICTNDTTEDDTMYICNCTMTFAQFDADKSECVCMGASYADVDENYCAPYDFATCDSSNICTCPEPTIQHDDCAQCVVLSNVEDNSCPWYTVLSDEDPNYCLALTGAVVDPLTGFSCTYGTSETIPDTCSNAYINFLQY